MELGCAEFLLLEAADIGLFPGQAEEELIMAAAR
jgi:hypothetical protein